MICPEILAGMRDQFTVRRMIDCFDARDLGLQRWQMKLDMLDEFGLGIGRSRDEHGAGIGNRIGDLGQEFAVLGRMAATYAVGLVVDMAGWVVRVQNITTTPRSTSMTITPNSMISNSSGETTTRRHLSPSGATCQPRSAAGRCAVQQIIELLLDHRPARRQRRRHRREPGQCHRLQRRYDLDVPRKFGSALIADNLSMRPVRSTSKGVIEGRPHPAVDWSPEITRGGEGESPKRRCSSREARRPDRREVEPSGPLFDRCCALFEAQANGSVVVGRYEVGAWSRIT